MYGQLNFYHSIYLMFIWSPEKHQFFIFYCMCLFISVWVQQQNQEGNDAVTSWWLVGFGVQPWRRAVDVFLHVNILTVSPFCLPAPLRSAGCVFMWEEERLCLFLCLFVFVCVCCTYGAGWVQYCAADASANSASGAGCKSLNWRLAIKRKGNPT